MSNKQFLFLNSFIVSHVCKTTENYSGKRMATFHSYQASISLSLLKMISNVTFLGYLKL